LDHIVLGHTDNGSEHNVGGPICGLKAFPNEPVSHGVSQGLGAITGRGLWALDCCGQASPRAFLFRCALNIGGGGEEQSKTGCHVVRYAVVRRSITCDPSSRFDLYGLIKAGDYLPKPIEKPPVKAEGREKAVVREAAQVSVGSETENSGSTNGFGRYLLLL
jgi:hypothetical protein